MLLLACLTIVNWKVCDGCEVPNACMDLATQMLSPGAKRRQTCAKPRPAMNMQPAAGATTMRMPPLCTALCRVHIMPEHTLRELQGFMQPHKSCDGDSHEACLAQAANSAA